MIPGLNLTTLPRTEDRLVLEFHTLGDDFRNGPRVRADGLVDLDVAKISHAVDAGMTGRQLGGGSGFTRRRAGREEHQAGGEQTLHGGASPR